MEGTNCEDESAYVFRALRTEAETVHLNQLVRNGKEHRDLEDYHVLVLPGGFASGDYVRAGAIWAARMKSRLRGEVERFVEAGKPVVGICNGFQVLVEMGLLPALGGETEVPQAALATNDTAHYECRPSLLKFENRGRCGPLARFRPGQVMLTSSAHTEGKFTFPQGEEETLWQRLLDEDQLLFRYVDPDGAYAGYPWNPNGSFRNIAGVCSPEGNVLGVMPHPERAFSRYLHPDWTRRPGDENGDGRRFFESIVAYVESAL